MDLEKEIDKLSRETNCEHDSKFLDYIKGWDMTG